MCRHVRTSMSPRARVAMDRERPGEHQGEWMRWTCADNVNARAMVQMKGRNPSGHQRAWVPGRMRTVRVEGKEWTWVGRRTGGHERAWTHGVVSLVEENLEMGWRVGAWMRRCAWGVGAREKLERGGSGHQRAWMLGRGVRTVCVCVDGVCGIQKVEMGSEKARWASASVVVWTCAYIAGARERVETEGGERVALQSTTA